VATERCSVVGPLVPWFGSRDRGRLGHDLDVSMAPRRLGRLNVRSDVLHGFKQKQIADGLLLPKAN
jgi:hypothetical protein